MSEPPDFDETTERGVHNPRVIDLIAKVEDRIVVTMMEFRDWGSDPEQLDQIEVKFNNYLDYIFDGHLVQQYPQYQNLPITIAIQSRQEPDAHAASLFQAMQRYLESIHVGFEVSRIDRQ